MVAEATYSRGSSRSAAADPRAGCQRSTATTRGGAPPPADRYRVVVVSLRSPHRLGNRRWTPAGAGRVRGQPRILRHVLAKTSSRRRRDGPAERRLGGHRTQRRIAGLERIVVRDGGVPVQSIQRLNVARSVPRNLRSEVPPKPTTAERRGVVHAPADAAALQSRPRSKAGPLSARHRGRRSARRARSRPTRHRRARASQRPRARSGPRTSRVPPATRHAGTDRRRPGEPRRQRCAPVRPRRANGRRAAGWRRGAAVDRVLVAREIDPLRCVRT